MRISFIFLFIFSFQLLALNTKAQDAVIELKTNSMTVGQLINEIEKQTDYLVVYSNREIDAARKVDVQRKSDKVSSYLNEAFAGTDIGYDFENNYIVLMKKANKNAATVADMIRTAQQQGKTITGKVVDANGEPVIGANIIEVGTTNGTVTDIDGNFSLKIADNATIRVSYIGYVEQEIKTAGRTSFNITLVDDTQSLEEVVVVGYGTQKRANVSGSITSLNSKDLHTMATNDLAKALQGQAPVFTARSSGKPGSGSTIFIRGVGTMSNSSPLWIIDGIQGAPLESFEDVESVQILKDAASTAIYGVRGANGVILVTTKKGKSGKISVKYDGFAKINNAMGLPKLLDTQSYIDMYKDRWMSNNPTATEDMMKKSIKSFYFLPPNEVAQLPSTDWVDVMFRQGMDQIHTLSISGGTDKSTYLISTIFENDKGTLVHTNYSKYSFKFDFSQNLTKWLKLGETFNYRFGKEIPFVAANIWQDIFRSNPALKVYDATNPMGTGYGYFTDTFASTIDWQGGNALESAMMTDYWSKGDNAWGNLQVIISPIKDLTWTTNISGTANRGWSSNFNYNIYSGISINSANYVSTTNAIGKQFTYSQGDSRSYFLNSFINYNKTLGKHEIGAMIGTEVSEGDSWGASGFAKYGIPAQDLRTTAVTSARDGNNSWGESSSYSQFGRLTYSFDNRYLMTATFRNDASGKFAPGKRNAFFPAASVGWNLARESFFQMKEINDLKFRFGWGRSGLDDVPSDLWRQQYVLQSNGTWTAQKVVNKNITWEKTTTNNLGLDLGVWDNALTASFDLYDKETKDALIYISLPSTTGFSSYYVNKGSIQNRGFELSLGYKNYQNKFQYSINANIAYNENKVLNIGNASYLSGGNYNRTFTNGPVSAFYGFVADGLYQSQKEIDDLNANAKSKGYDAYDGSIAPGDIKFKDLNGDGTITSDKDQTIIGNPWPKYVYGLNFNFQYVGFDLSMNWQGIAKIDVYNNILQYTQNMYGDWNSTKAVFNSWSSDNSTSSIPRLGNASHNYGRSSSYLIEDGSYLRLKNVQLGYNLNRNILSKLNMSQFRIYFGIENALTFTQFKGFDPEFMSGNNYQRGVYDLNQYPQSRSFIFGLQLGI